MGLIFCPIIQFHEHAQDPESFARGGPTLTPFFCCFFSLMSDVERKDPITTISGPSTARQRNAT